MTLALDLSLRLFRRGLNPAAAAAAAGWEDGFDSIIDGVVAALILDFAGVADGGQYFANDDNTKEFGDLIDYTGASLALQRNDAGTLVFKPHNLHL